MFQINKINDERVVLQISLDGNQTKVYNLRPNMANSYVCIAVAKYIRKMVNHRRRVIFMHGGLVTTQKIHAIDRILYRINNAQAWDIKFLPRILNLIIDDLMIIMPGQSSKFRKGYEDKLAEIIGIANSDKIKNLMS